MPHKPVRHNRAGEPRRRRERGVALVEAAIILPVLLLLVFGIIEIGLLIDSATVTSNASRAGARLASSNYAEAETSLERAAVLETVALSVEEALNGLRGNVTPEELWVYQANAAGYPSGTSFTTCSGSCLEFTWDETTDSFAPPSGSWADPQACGTDLDRVGVYVRADHDFMTSVLGDGRTIEEHSVMRIEPRNDCT